jgi:hypothetical protein
LLKYLSEWQRNLELHSGLDVDEQKISFLPRECWSDAQQACLGFIGLSRYWVPLGATIYGRVCSQDIVEHHFANLRFAMGSTGAVGVAQAFAADTTAAMIRGIKVAGKKGNAKMLDMSAREDVAPTKVDKRRVTGGSSVRQKKRRK